MESELNDFSRENYLKNKKKNKKDFNVDFIDDEPNNNAETNDNNDANKNSVFGLSFEELVNQTTARFPQNKEEEINPEFENYDEDLRKENSKKSKLKEKKQNKKEDINERKEKTDSEIYQKKISKSDKHKHDDNKLKEKKHKKKEKKEESEKKDPNAFSFEIDQEEEESENSKEENSVEEVKYHNYKKDTKKNFEDEDYDEDEKDDSNENNNENNKEDNDNDFEINKEKVENEKENEINNDEENNEENEENESNDNNNEDENNIDEINYKRENILKENNNNEFQKNNPEKEEENKIPTEKEEQKNNIKNDKNEIEIIAAKKIKIERENDNEKPQKKTKKQKLTPYDLINNDPSLKDYESYIKERNVSYSQRLMEIEMKENSLENFSKSYEYMGVNILSNGDIKYREYAPGAKGISIYGEFNNWNKEQYWAQKDKYGFWEIIIPNENGHPKIQHGQILKINVVLEDGNWMERNPIWSKYLVQNRHSQLLENILWNPEIKYNWKSSKKHLPKPESLRIYEVHIGMSSYDPKISTYREFANTILPRIKETGYTAILLMSIMEHADYASFGYHVNYLFAISSRFGTPEDFKYLIDKAHQMNLYVIMDLIHSHASSNVDDGFNYWDGTDHLYFYGGEKGKHIRWDSKIYDYSCYETMRLLLSNCAYYIKEYRIDGYRFSGITSILYNNHGIDYNFTGEYNQYFCDNYNQDGGTYLMLANKLIHSLNKEAITIAEDNSGMPGLCYKIKDGGFGFDYKIDTHMSDKWKNVLIDYKDEDWNVGNIIYTLTNRRYNEKQISYIETHDQSFKGNYPLCVMLFNDERFWNMSCKKPETIGVGRGMALYKMIKLLSFALGGEGYLCFMGNDFCNPDSIELPMKDNRYTYSHCRIRWDLCDNTELRYQYLHNWEIAMNKLEEVFKFISNKHNYISTKHEDDKVIAFEKGPLLFVFNFHPVKSFTEYPIGTKWKSRHIIIMDSDELRFLGQERLKLGHSKFCSAEKEEFNKRPYNIKLYLPSRTCMVLIAEENMKKYDLSKLKE